MKSADFLSAAGGVGLCLVLAVAASFLGSEFHLIGGPVFGILLGIAVGNLFGKPAFAAPGIAFTSKKVLQGSIILLGFGLSLKQILAVGADSFFIMLATLGGAFLAAFWIGRLFKVSGDLTTLIGVGTGVCGGSAIAAVAPVIEAKDEDIAYAISTIFLFNVLAVFIFPFVGRLAGFSETVFGMWAGTAINDTSSVVAAGYSYGGAAGDYAVIVKLTRTTMIVPITFGLSLIVAARKRKAAASAGGASFSFAKVFPWFILGFLAAALVNTLGVLPGDVTSALVKAGRFMIVMALSAVGLGTNFKKLLSTGARPLVLGLAVWFVVAVTSLLVQKASGAF